LHTAGRLTVQASLFARYSELRYTPDVLGELLFNGLAQAARKTDLSAGGQFEGAYKAGEHTLRGGLVISTDRTTSRTSSRVFPLDSAGAQVGEPILILDTGRARA